MDRPDFKTKDKMKAKKSQVTMLIIIGLIVLIAVGFIIYLSKASFKKPAQQSTKKVQETQAELQPVKEFVSKCLDKLGKDALQLIGSQGGYIYSSQGGTLVDLSSTDEGRYYVVYTNNKVIYNIKQPNLLVPYPYSFSEPNYPWVYFPYRTGCSGTKTFEGIFGISTLPPLEPSQGPHSIKTQIETYIDSNLQDCLDFSAFEKQGYEIKTEKSRTGAIIGKSDVTLVSKIPATVTNKATNEALQLEEFSSSINLRLSDLYYFVRNLIYDDITDIRFNITDKFNNKDNFNIRLIENIYNHDDLIIVTDLDSLLYGKQFQYIFVRENRRPALHCIKNTVLEFPRNYAIKQEDLLDESELIAEDPDEDAIQFTIKSPASNPNLPTILDKPQIQFKIEASDMELSDHHIITVRENE